MQQFIGKIVSNSEDKNKSRNVLQIITAVSCLAISEQGWQINTDNADSDQSASTHAPQGTARYPTKARGPT